MVGTVLFNKEIDLLHGTRNLSANLRLQSRYMVCWGHPVFFVGWRASFLRIEERGYFVTDKEKKSSILKTKVEKLF